MFLKHESRCELAAHHWEEAHNGSKVAMEYLTETVDLVRDLFDAKDVI